MHHKSVINIQKEPLQLPGQCYTRIQETMTVTVTKGNKT